MSHVDLIAALLNLATAVAVLILVLLGQPLDVVQSVVQSVVEHDEL